MLSQCQQSRLQPWRGIHSFLHVFALLLLVAEISQVGASVDTPAPIWITTNAQTEWDGNDGPWSTFNLQIGEQKLPAQVVRVVPAFHHGHIIVVARDGCPDGKLPRNCSEIRGGVFDYKTTNWWDGDTKIFGNKSSPFPPGQTMGRLNTTITITGESPTKLHSQNVLLTQTMDPFVGVVGLAQADDTLVAGQRTFLRSAMQPPSSVQRAMTFSYTAGVASTNAPGSLFLGGYDASRLQPNTSLKIGLKTVLNGLRQFSIVSNYIKVVDQQSSIKARIDLGFTNFVLDPVTPYIWLPVDTMAQLEKTMGLQYDTASQLYLLPSPPAPMADLYLGIWGGINSSAYQIPGSAPIEANSTALTPDHRLLLSAQSLILNASYPIYNGTLNGTNSKQYVPFKKGPYPANGEYTLGRAFFQSVHIIANYEMEGFSLAQARYDSADSRAPTGLSNDSLGPVSNGSPIPFTPDNGGSNVDLAVILVAVLCTVGILTLCISIYGCCAYRKAKWPFKRRRNQEDDGDVLRTAKAELDGAASSALNNNGLSVTSTEISVVSEMEASSSPVEMRGSPIVKAELDGDMPSYELDARPKSIDWGNKDADPSVIVRRLLAR